MKHLFCKTQEYIVYIIHKTESKHIRDAAKVLGLNSSAHFFFHSYFKALLALLPFYSFEQVTVFSITSVIIIKGQNLRSKIKA